jgi:hypothetical protein
MHLLPCPACQSSIAVYPSQAGDVTKCPSCQETVEIPKLGQLRQLPQSDSEDGGKSASLSRQSDSSSASRVAFVVVGVIATASLLIAGFCAIRWALIDVPDSTEGHISRLRETYKALTPAELIREYEQMEEYGTEMPMPYEYKRIELEKNKWGRNASIASAVTAVAILGLVFLIVAGRGNRRPLADT